MFSLKICEGRRELESDCIGSYPRSIIFNNINRGKNGSECPSWVTQKVLRRLSQARARLAGLQQLLLIPTVQLNNLTMTFNILQTPIAAENMGTGSYKTSH